VSHSYLIAGCRTPIGKLLGGLSTVSSPALGGIAIAEAIRRASVSPHEVDEVILGCVLAAGLGQAPARQAALKAGLPPSVAALTINKVCGSGLKAVMLADQAIRAGDAALVVAGGMENMSRAPHLLLGTRPGWKLGNQQVLDSMIHDGLWCAIEDVGMGVHADFIAASRGISREQQDAFAAQSHARAIAAAQTMREEIVPVTVTQGKQTVVIQADEGPRTDSNVTALAKLRPAFSASGTVTAGNSSQISDGAAAIVVASEAIAKQHPSPLRARIVATATAGVPPKELFIAPVGAIQAALGKAGLSADEIDLFELNEAFAAQCLACLNPLGIPPEKVNVLGGAIALGHPIGASGARILVTLLHELARRNLRRGLCALCLGGGHAVAMIIERE
jgi:acetyl-CoA C-acetyltransferase